MRAADDGQEARQGRAYSRGNDKIRGFEMRRRTLLSASLGLGALAAGVNLVSGSDSGQALPPGDESPARLGLYTDSGLAFGTMVTIKVLHGDAAAAHAAIEHALSEVRMVDALMSVQQDRSQVGELNRQGSVALPHRHLLEVLKYTQQLSELTAGAFDITVQPLWRAFSRAHERGELPSVDEVVAAKSLVDWRRLVLDPQRLRLATAGMAITLNGVAQGYAVDLAVEALRRAGVQHALIDTGEFGSMGHKDRGRPWVLGVAHPRQHDVIAAALKPDGRKVATSGDYETYFSPDFVHHHIFDPATGESPPELASVTVVAATGIEADGLSTAFMVMGADKALALAARLPDVDVLLIDKQGRSRQTPGFPALPAERLPPVGG
jgi:thiamine biosynthesis lipoprotein